MGDIKEHKKGREVYEQEKSAGQKAGLIDQERPNTFTFGRQYRAARNRGRADRIPGAGVTVRQRILAAGAAGGGAALLPEPIVQTVDFTAGGQGWGQVTDPVPDRDRISPLVLDPRKQPPVNPVAITVHLQAGFPLAAVNSYHHAVTLSEEAGGRLIKLADGPGAGRSRLRAGLDAGRDQRAVGRAVSRADRRRRLPARLRDAARGGG